MPDLFGRQFRSRPGRLARRRREKVLLYIVLYSAFLFAFVGLLSYLSFRPEYRIEEIRVEGNRLIPARALVEESAKVLDGAYGGLFSRRNRFIYPSGALAKHLYASFFALRNLSLQAVSPNLLAITVTERKPIALWCAGMESVGEQVSPCYFLDEDGLLFAASPDISPGVYRRFFGSISSSTPAVGETVMAPDVFRELNLFLDSLGTFDLTPSAVTFIPNPGGNLDYSIEVGGGARLLISGTRRLQETLSDITAFFNDPEILGSRKQFISRLDYIDFRFANKVYYK